MRRTDVEAVGALAGDMLAAGGRLVKDMHEGIAGRPFNALGPWAAPVRVIHDGISKTVYTGVQAGLRGAATRGARAAARRAPVDGPPVGSRPRSSLALGALNGLYGDHLAARRRELALTMEVRRDGCAVTVTPDGLSDAFPDATSRIVMFVHGLCETDMTWKLRARGADRSDRRTLGERLQDELSFTPIYLRYNTGLRVCDNGRALAKLLEALVQGWPGGVEELALVGHAMGGWVARSACHYGEETGMRFTASVRHVFCLGPRHVGADLEKGASFLAWALSRLPETHGMANLLNARSSGIKDLRFGSTVEEDWCDCEPDEFLRDRCHEVPLLPEAGYHEMGLRLSQPAAYEQLRTWITRPGYQAPSSSSRTASALAGRGLA